MKNARLILACASLVSFASPLFSAPPGGTAAGWQLVFDEGFNAPLSATKWNLTKYGPTPNGYQTSGDAGARWGWCDNYTIDTANSWLRLSVTKPSSATFNCGRIETSGVKEFTYGYWEARMKCVTRNLGVQSSFWMKNYPNGDASLSTNEVDINETFGQGNGYKATVHKGINGQAGHQSWAKQVNVTPNIDQTFNTYGCEWNSTSLKFYFNDVLVHTYTGVGVPGPTVRMPVILSMEAFSAIQGNANTTTFPQYTYVEWVHVYQK